MIVDTSKIIVFALVAAAALGVQMYRDNMTRVNLRLNVENALMIGILAIILLMLHENISSVVERMESMDTAPTSTDATTTNTEDTSLATSPATQQIISDSTMTTQTIDPPVVSAATDTPAIDTTTAPQPTPTDVLNAPILTGPTGQPASIPNTGDYRSTIDSSNVVSALDAQPAVQNSSPIAGPNVRIKIESDDLDEDDIEVDITVNSDMQGLQNKVRGHLGKLVKEDQKNEGLKYVISDPSNWVSENQYKVNILPQCQVCPVVMCEQNFMLV